MREAILRAIFRLLLRSTVFCDELDRQIAKGFEHFNDMGPDAR